MNDIMKPWIVMVSAVVLNWLLIVVGIYDLSAILRSLFWLFTCFTFGLSLSDFKKKSNAWVLKLIIAGILLILFLFEINVVKLSFLDQIMYHLRIHPDFLRFIYIWCGWAFFRK